MNFIHLSDDPKDDLLPTSRIFFFITCSVRNTNSISSWFLIKLVKLDSWAYLLCK